MFSPLKPEILNKNSGKQKIKNKNILIFILLSKLTNIKISKSQKIFKKIVL